MRLPRKEGPRPQSDHARCSFCRKLCVLRLPRKEEPRPQSDHARRSFFSKLCVLRLPRKEEPRPQSDHARRSFFSKLCVLRLPRKEEPRPQSDHARRSPFRRLCVLRLPRKEEPRPQSDHARRSSFKRLCVLRRVRWVVCEMSCVWDELCVRWVVCEMSCVWDELCEMSGVRWGVWDELCEMRGVGWVVWDELCVRWVVCEMSCVWDELCVRWVVCEMSCVWDELCVRWVVCEMRWVVWDEWCEMRSARRRRRRRTNRAAGCKQENKNPTVMWGTNSQSAVTVTPSTPLFQNQQSLKWICLSFKPGRCCDIANRNQNSCNQALRVHWVDQTEFCPWNDHGKITSKKGKGMTRNDMKWPNAMTDTMWVVFVCVVCACVCVYVRAPLPQAPSEGSVYCACHAERSRGPAGDNPRPNSWRRLCVLRLPHNREPRPTRRQSAPQIFEEALCTAPARQRRAAAQPATIRAATPSGGSVYCACHAKEGRGPAGDNPRRSSFRRLCVLRLPRREKARPSRRQSASQLLQEALCTAPATQRRAAAQPATTRAAAPSEGSVYCACHAERSRGPAGDNPRPNSFRRLCVLRLPRTEKPRPSRRQSAPQLLQKALCTVPARQQRAAATAATIRATPSSGSSAYCACHALSVRWVVCKMSCVWDELCMMWDDLCMMR